MALIPYTCNNDRVVFIETTQVVAVEQVQEEPAFSRVYMTSGLSFLIQDRAADLSYDIKNERRM